MKPKIMLIENVPILREITIFPHEESGSRVPLLRGSKCGFKRYSILKVKLIFR